MFRVEAYTGPTRTRMLFVNSLNVLIPLTPITSVSSSPQTNIQHVATKKYVLFVGVG